jgi:hypothetical protein
MMMQQRPRPARPDDSPAAALYARYLAVGFNAGTVAAVYPYLLDTKTHTTSPLPFPTAGYQLPQASWTRGRTFAWADSHTLLFFYGGNTAAQGSAGPTYRYDVNTKKLALMPGVHHAAEGVVRCSTLFYLELTPTTDFLGERNGYNVYQGSALLHRYDLKTNSEIGQPITIGPTMKISLATPGGFPSDPVVPTWNVSSDGTLLAYPQEAIDVTAMLTQRYVIANADGTNARLFVPPTRSVPTNTWNMEISPNDQYVLIAADADNFSMNLDGSNYRAYGSYGATFISINGPAWLPDSSGFDTVNTHQQGQTFADPYLSRYLLSTPPGSDGYVPGTELVPEVGSLAGLS